MPKTEPTHTTPDHEPPTLDQLRKGTAIAAAAAFMVLIAWVMPAEYNVDPLGTGSWFGLTELGTAEATPGPSEASLDPLTADGFRADAVTFVLRPGESKEYKISIDQGQVLHYEWATSNERRVRFDFHGDQEGQSDLFESYEQGTGSSRAGSFDIPFDGRHGWWISNPGPETTEITIRFAGNYDTSGFVA